MIRLFSTLGLALSGLAFAAGAAEPDAATWRDPVTGMEFVAIAKGCFAMGNAEVVLPETSKNTPEGERVGGFVDELPQHEACVDTFWLGKREVRADEWQRLMGGKAPKPELPAARVTWEQAQAYAARLTERSDGRDRYRLPTEAEWEYACRAGATTESLLSSSDEVKVAWFEKTTEQKIEPQPVGQLAANAFGLHDMLGNVWEWVQDSYVADGYTRHTLYDPLVEAPGADRVIRGGSYRSEAVLVRCAKRAFYAPADTLGTIGFRLVRVPQEP